MPESDRILNPILRQLWNSTVGKLVAIVSVLAAFASIASFFFPDISTNWRNLILFSAIVIIVSTVIWTMYRAICSLANENRNLRTQSISIQPAVTLGNFAPRSSPEDLARFTGKAEVLYFYGITLSTLIARHRVTIEKLRVQGCHFRFLLPDLENLTDSIQAVSLNWAASRTLIDEHQNCLRWLANLAKQEGGNFQIRLTNVLPTVSLLFVNPGRQEGRLRVSLHLYRGSFETRPFVEIAYQDNKEWYEFFYDLYFVQLWNKSVEYVPGSEGEIQRARGRIQRRSVEPGK